MNSNNNAWPDDSHGSWLVLRTRSRQEKALAKDLAAREVGHFLPLVIRTKFYGDRKVKVELPLFPGYLFLRGALDAAYEADRSGRVAQIIPVHNQEQFDSELRSIHTALQGNATLDPYPYLQNGVRVEVREGPFRGLQGVIEDRNRPDRLILQVETLGQAVSVEIDGSLLDVID